MGVSSNDENPSTELSEPKMDDASLSIRVQYLGYIHPLLQLEEARNEGALLISLTQRELAHGSDRDLLSSLSFLADEYFFKPKSEIFRLAKILSSLVAGSPEIATHLASRVPIRDFELIDEISTKTRIAVSLAFARCITQRISHSEFNSLLSRD